MSDELKPCPFCGSEAETITAWNSMWRKDMYRIACSNKACPIDYIVTKQHATEAQAIAAWNTRADDAQVIKNVDSYNLGVNEHMDNGVSVHMCPNDLREQLEADIRKWTECSWVTAPHEKVIEWLDRQAAITKNECREEHRKRLGELHGLLDEAAREREELAWRVEYNGELVEKVKRERNELQHENDALKERISQSAAHDTAETAENGASKSEIRNFDDSREQLEADISKWWEGEWLRDLYNNENMVRVVGRWLDRQAAITTAECTSEDESCCEACRAAQKRKIAELTDERDELRAEVDNLRKRNDSQADTIRRLRAEFDAALDDLARAVEDKRSHPF